MAIALLAGLALAGCALSVAPPEAAPSKKPAAAARKPAKASPTPAAKASPGPTAAPSAAPTPSPTPTASPTPTPTPTPTPSPTPTPAACTREAPSAIPGRGTAVHGAYNGQTLPNGYDVAYTSEADLTAAIRKEDGGANWACFQKFYPGAVAVYNQKK